MHKLNEAGKFWITAAGEHFIHALTTERGSFCQTGNTIFLRFRNIAQRHQKKAIEEYLLKEEVNEREKQEDMLRWQRYQDTGEHLSHDEVRTRLTRLADQARTKTAG